MVFKYKRKTARASWSEESLERATKLVKEEGKSINSAAKKLGIPFTTLHRHLKSGSVSKKLGRYIPVFTPEQEEDLCAYLKKLDSLFFGLTRSEFLDLVFEYARKNNITHPFKNGKAGDDWFAGFKRRHPEIVLRAPEPTSLARTRGFNRPQVELFYKNFWDLVEKYKFDATTIYNMDETGVKSSTSRPPKVLSIKGKRQVGVVSSAERGQLTTVICCCNAAGTYVPPFFIFARKRMQERLLDGAPPGSQATVSDNGWVNGEAFLNWLQFFADTVRPNENRKILLLLDNHESHKYYPALEFASKNNIIFLSFAPHTTDRMQPLDVAVYGPLKKYFEQEINTFQKSHPGRIVNQYDMAKLFGGAYVKSASVQNAVNGFKKPGIWPYDPNVFGDEDYAPSTMTDRPLNEAQSSLDDTPCNSASSVVPHSPTDLVSTQNLMTDLSAKENPEQCTTPIPDPILEQGPLQAPVANLTPLQIRPIPTMAAPKTNRKNKRQKSEILTSTPVKAEQAAKYIKVNKKKTNISELASSSKIKKNKIKKTELPGHSQTKRTKTSSKAKTKADLFCLVCAEKYTEPLVEDWIQCSQCQNWAHENCTSYAGVGSYFCDECED